MMKKTDQHQTENHILYLSSYLMCRVSIWILLQDAGLGNNHINNGIHLEKKKRTVMTKF